MYSFVVTLILYIAYTMLLLPCNNYCYNILERKGNSEMWSRANKDNSNTRYSGAIGPSYYKEKWKIDFSFPVSEPIEIGNGTVVAALHKEGRKIVAVNSAGQLVWEYIAKDNLIHTPSFDGKSRIYFADYSGEIYCLFLNGKENWTSRTEEKKVDVPELPRINNREGREIRISSPIILLDNKIIIVIDDLVSGNSSICFINSDGKTNRVEDINSPCRWNSPCFINGSKFVVSGAKGTLICLNKDGDELWEYDCKDNIIGFETAFSLENGKLLIGASNGILYCIDELGNLVWQIAFRSQILGVGSISNKDIAIISCVDGSIHCLDTRGNLLWEKQNESQVSTYPILDYNSSVYYGTSAGVVVSLNSDGSTKWTQDVGSSIVSMSIGADGTMYICTKDCRLIAVH